jgi:hypothetical protein
MAPPFSIRAAAAHEMSGVASLFRDYAASLGVDLSYRGFEAERASLLPGAYAPPTGLLLLACAPNGTSLDCVAAQSTRRLLLVLRRFGSGIPPSAPAPPSRNTRSA